MATRQPFNGQGHLRQWQRVRDRHGRAGRLHGQDPLPGYRRDAPGRLNRPTMPLAAVRALPAGASTSVQEIQSHQNLTRLGATDQQRTQRGARGMPKPTMAMMSRWTSLVPPPKVKIV